MTRVFQGWSRDRDLISRAEHHFERREIDVSLLVNKPYREISQFLAKLSEKSTVNKSTARNSRYIAIYLRILLNLYYIPGTFCRKTESVIFFFFFFFLFLRRGDTELLGNVALTSTTTTLELRDHVDER